MLATHIIIYNHWKDTNGSRYCKVTLVKNDTETHGDIYLKKELITQYALDQGVTSQSPSSPQEQNARNDTTA